MSPLLPQPRGPLSFALADALRGEPADNLRFPEAEDPFGDDLQLALLMAYELHYLGFEDVDPAWEWHPPLLQIRAGWERRLLEGLRQRVRPDRGAVAMLADIETQAPSGRGVGDHLLNGGSWEQAREYFAHRSIYQLKEADPYAWLVPRLRGVPKAALAAVEFDEFGAGRGDQVHARLFEDLLGAADLDVRYFAYLDAVPAVTMMLSNVATLFGLHRRLRGAAIGHFAVTELTTGPSARKLERALKRFGAPQECVYFYSEHVEADAVHELVLRHDVVEPVIAENPALDADIAFGIAANLFVEDALAEHLLTAWDDGRSSLGSAA